MAKLVADEKALGPLLEFLKATEIGDRKGARERELEWERRNGHAGEDLLSDYVKKGKSQEGESPKVAEANAARQRNKE